MGGYVSLLTVSWAQPPKSQLYHARSFRRKARYHSDKADNRWANLFFGHQCDNPNDKLRKDNCSGCRGVGVRRRDGRWRVRITVGGRPIYLGDRVDLEQAIAARKAAEHRYFGSWHSEALALKLRAVLGERYTLRQIPVVRAT
jgi:hypothetical protein